ncbi:MAG: hypothetical protein OEV72_12415, partial [Thermoleophilia bacterium]|nr:hypothetical protein [Thermoleophilia bacterium]
LRGAGWALAGTSYVFLVAQHAWFATALAGLHLYGEDWAPGDVEAWSRTSGVLAAALVGGVLLLRAAPRVGAACIAGASLGTAGLMWWALPMMGPIAVAATTGAAVLARRRVRTIQRASSATS